MKIATKRASKIKIPVGFGSTFSQVLNFNFSAAFPKWVCQFCVKLAQAGKSLPIFLLNSEAPTNTWKKKYIIVWLCHLQLVTLTNLDIAITINFKNAGKKCWSQPSSTIRTCRLYNQHYRLSMSNYARLKAHGFNKEVGAILWPLPNRLKKKVTDVFLDLVH